MVKGHFFSQTSLKYLTFSDCIESPSHLQEGKKILHPVPLQNTTCSQVKIVVLKKRTRHTICYDDGNDPMMMMVMFTPSSHPLKCTLVLLRVIALFFVQKFGEVVWITKNIYKKKVPQRRSTAIKNDMWKEMRLLGCLFASQSLIQIVTLSLSASWLYSVYYFIKSVIQT